MSARPLPVPEACRCAYDGYLADLNRAALAEGTRARRARHVRRFLRWLAAGGGDAGIVLAQREAWDTAVAGFVSDLAASAGMATIDGYREALADCARRLGLATPPTTPRFGWVRNRYATALAKGPYSAAAIRSNLAMVRAFLRWLGETGYAGDLQRDWGTAGERYLQHLAANGRAASTVRRHRQVLSHCAGRLKLPSALVATRDPGGGGSTGPDARCGARSTDSPWDRPKAVP